MPDFDRIDPVPGGEFVRLQQIVDRGTGPARAISRLIAEGFDIVAAPGMLLHPEQLDDLIGGQLVHGVHAAGGAVLTKLSRFDSASNHADRAGWPGRQSSWPKRKSR